MHESEMNSYVRHLAEDGVHPTAGYEVLGPKEGRVRNA